MGIYTTEIIGKFNLADTIPVTALYLVKVQIL